MKLSDLQKAFALAHKAADDPETPVRERKYFKAIAHLIWRSVGVEDMTDGEPDFDDLEYKNGGRQ